MSEIEPMPCMCCDSAPPSLIRTLMCYNPSMGGPVPISSSIDNSSEAPYENYFRIGTPVLNMVGLVMLWIGDWKPVYDWDKIMLSEGIFAAIQLIMFILSKVLTSFDTKKHELLVFGANVLREAYMVVLWAINTDKDAVSSDIYTYTDLVMHIASFGVSVFSLLEGRHHKQMATEPQVCVDHVMCIRGSSWDPATCSCQPD